MEEDLRAILSNPEVYPLELTLVSGHVITIPHPDFVHFPPRLKNIIFFPPEKTGASFELISPEAVAKVSGKTKRSAA